MRRARRGRATDTVARRTDGMGQIARRAGISKAALYHYFKGKRAFFEATLQGAAQEVARLTAPDPLLPPLEALAGSVARYLGWIEQHPGAYRSLMRGAGRAREVTGLIDTIRADTARRILAALPQSGDSARARLAVRSWLWLMDGAILDWLEHRDLERAQLAAYLRCCLVSLLAAAGALADERDH